MTADEIVRLVAARHGDRPELMVPLLAGALGQQVGVERRNLPNLRSTAAARARPQLEARRHRLAALNARATS
jgi:hypothetical protein